MKWNEFTEKICNAKSASEVAKVFEDINGSLEDIPILDLQPVVRCRDCIYDNRISCPLCYIEKHDLCFIQHDPDFYCAKGRKEGEDE